ncbi:ATP-binding cassette domain-containing protein, partial [Actinotignum sp. GS-2025b]
MTTLETPGSKRSLKAVDIWKLFAGTPALSGVSLTVHPGEVVGLVGHNGAGKSTLLKVLSGAYRNDDGYLEVDGERVTFASPSDALSHGVATVYQELSLLPNLSVTENTFLGREVRKGPNLDRS